MIAIYVKIFPGMMCVLCGVCLSVRERDGVWYVYDGLCDILICVILWWSVWLYVILQSIHTNSIFAPFRQIHTGGKHLTPTFTILPPSVGSCNEWHLKVNLPRYVSHFFSFFWGGGQFACLTKGTSLLTFLKYMYLYSKTRLSHQRVTRQSVQVDGEAKVPIYS